MRLLVTNARCAQAYAVLRALRPYAETVIATTSGPRPLGIWPTCHAAYSRLIDRRYRVPDPELDWFEGRIQPENTQREQEFVDAILRLCERERIDTIFPSVDPWVYVFSKNKGVFEKNGVLIPVPDYDTVVGPLDKFRTMRFAEETGFPTPRTILPESVADLTRVAAEIAPPWIIKPRFTSGGRGLTIATELGELRTKTGLIEKQHGMPMIQEYIPGRGKQNFYLVVDRSGRAVSTFTPSVTRVSGRVFRNETGACITVPPHPLTDQAVELVARMGWWGGATVQTKVDGRDGSLRLMEVNPRLGTHLWYRTEVGINEPLMCLKIARGEVLEPFGDYPLGCTLIDPVKDIVEFLIDLLDLAVYRIRSAALPAPLVDPRSPPRSLQQLLHEYRQPYRSGTEKRMSPYVRYALEDPLPAMIWTSKVFARGPLMNMKGLGR